MKNKSINLVIFHLSDNTEQIQRGCFLHLDVGEEFLASILQTGAEEVDRIVDNEKTVVIALSDTYINRWILLVMPLYIQLKFHFPMDYAVAFLSN